MTANTLSAGTAKQQDLDVELLAVGKVLTVLERQLTAVSHDVEDSVNGVCRGFQGMAQQAQDAVTTASASLGIDEIGEGTDLVSDMRGVLEQLVQSIRESCEFSQTVSTRLTILEGRLGSIEKILKDIEALASRAKLVALNGQIEAARVGEAGLAFRVVAQETKELSLHASNTSSSIRSLVGQLASEIKGTSGELKKRSAEDTERFKGSEQQALNLLKAIDESHQRMTGSLSKTGEISTALRVAISRAVISLQFQDRVSQRIGHVIETLRILVNRVDEGVDPACEQAASEVSGEILSTIASRYTMNSERLALAPNVTPTQASSSTSTDFDVELF